MNRRRASRRTATMLPPDFGLLFRAMVGTNARTSRSSARRGRSPWPPRTCTSSTNTPADVDGPLCVLIPTRRSIHRPVRQHRAWQWLRTISQIRAFWSPASQLRVPLHAHHGWPLLAHAPSPQRSEHLAERSTPSVGGGWCVVSRARG